MRTNHFTVTLPNSQLLFAKAMWEKIFLYSSLHFHLLQGQLFLSLRGNAGAPCRWRERYEKLIILSSLARLTIDTARIHFLHGIRKKLNDVSAITTAIADPFRLIITYCFQSSSKHARIMYVNDISSAEHFISVVYCQTGITIPRRKAGKNILWACTPS